MNVIPVLDVKAGLVVRGIAGRREQYRPVTSRLCSSADPVDVAWAMRGEFGLNEFYLADLDAIDGGEPAVDVYEALIGLGMSLWVDAGIREPGMLRPLERAGVAAIVAGLETIRGPGVLEELVAQCGRPLIFSLDLKDGVPLGDRAAWGEADAGSIAGRAIRAGIPRIIVLDLGRVGVGAGTGTEALCGELIAGFPEAQIIAGGGVRGALDLFRLEQQGVHAVLVASALHDGRLCPQDLDALRIERPR